MPRAADLWPVAQNPERWWGLRDPDLTVGQSHKLPLLAWDHFSCVWIASMSFWVPDPSYPLMFHLSLRVFVCKQKYFFYHLFFSLNH